MIQTTHCLDKKHKKTEIYADNLWELNKWLIKQLKTWKGTPAKIEEVERRNNQVKEDLELVDPLLERMPAIRIKLNGFHNFNEGKC